MCVLSTTENKFKSSYPTLKIVMQKVGVRVAFFLYALQYVFLYLQLFTKC
jgi:hypothetical protein